MDQEKLIELVRENELLYNFNDKRYHDSKQKDAVWNEIGEELDKTGEECKTQWTSLRDSFRRNIRKRKSRSACTIKKWRFEDEMSFLHPYLQERSTSNCTDDIGQTSGNECDNESQAPFSVLKSKVSKDRKKTIPRHLSIQMKNCGTTNHPTSTKQTTTKINTSEQASTSEVLIKYLLENGSEKRDEIETLFYSLAQTVKKMDPYYRALAKSKVCAIVGELELESITHQSSGTVQSSYMPPDMPTLMPAMSPSSSCHMKSSPEL